MLFVVTAGVSIRVASDGSSGVSASSDSGIPGGGRVLIYSSIDAIVSVDACIDGSVSVDGNVFVDGDVSVDVTGWGDPCVK